jgi:hypothetical protein
LHNQCLASNTKACTGPLDGFWMNTLAPQSVSAKSSRQSRIVPVLLAALSLWIVLENVQCVGIDGGAAELTWSLRTFNGESSNCKLANVSHMRLCWNSVEDGDSGCRPGQFRDFECIQETGVTLFEIPPGSAKFNVVPICEDGFRAADGTYQAPSEIVRTVRDGEVVTLDALLIVVTDLDSCSGSACTCVRE